jgi:hypothetical protein
LVEDVEKGLGLPVQLAGIPRGEEQRLQGRQLEPAGVRARGEFRLQPVVARRFSLSPLFDGVIRSRWMRLLLVWWKGRR